MTLPGILSSVNTIGAALQALAFDPFKLQNNSWIESTFVAAIDSCSPRLLFAGSQTDRLPFPDMLVASCSRSVKKRMITAIATENEKIS